MAIQLAVNLSSPLFLPTKFPFKGHPKLDHSTIDTTISSAKEA